MNVRFFGGRKEEYLSIPKHNPLGLYFCADTRELFLGEKLLSDGLRVVPTAADLPSVSEHKAAEGVIYFVAATQNGYVLPRGGSEWLQVIYAPTSGENTDIDLSGYYTKAEVDAAILEAIANIKFEVDLTDYATKDYVAQKILEAELADTDFNAELYYTKNEVNTLVAGFATKEELPNIEGLASETYVDNKVAEVKVPTKVSELENDAGYLTAEDISSGSSKEVYTLDLSGLKASDVLTPEQDSILSMLFDSDNTWPYRPAAVVYVKDTQLDSTWRLVDKVYASKEVQADNLTFSSVLSVDNSENLAVIKELQFSFTRFRSVTDSSNVGTWYVDNATAIKSRELVTKDELAKATDLSNYYNKSETETLVNEAVKGLASEDFVRSEIAKAELNGGEVTEEELDNLLANYYNKTEIDNKIKNIDIPSIEGLATEDFVNNAIAGIEIPEAELYKVDFNAPNFAEATEAYEAGKLLVLTNAAPDVNSYAVMNYVSDSYITFTKFLTSRSEAYGTFNTYYLSANNTWEVSKEVRLNKVEANVEGEVNGELANLRIGKEIYKIPSTEGLVTTEELKAVEDKIPSLEGYAKLTDIPDTSEFATKDQIPSVDGFLTEIPEEYITEAELEAKGYLTEHQNLEEYAKKSELFSGSYNDLDNKPEIPSIAGLASEEYVNDKVASVKVPVSTSELTNDSGYITDAALADYVKSSALESYITEDKLANKDFITSAKLQEELAKIDPTIPSEYITETELEEKGYITATALEGFAKIEDIPDTAGFIKIEDVEAKGYLTAEAIANKADKSDLADLATKDELKVVEDKIPVIEGLASETYVDEKFNTIKVPTKTSELENDSSFLTSIPSEYITEDELNAKNYITDISNLATKSELEEAINNIQHPDTDLSDYYNKTQVDNLIPDVSEFVTETAVNTLLSEKADNILFTDNMIVKTPVGSFVENESLQNMTIKDIVTKLLGLTVYIPAPDSPEGTSQVVQDLMTNKSAPYMLGEEGDLVAVDYAYRTMTPAEAKEDNQDESFLYQIIDAEGNLLESGYQIATIYQENDYLTVLIPDTITDFTVVDYSPLDGDWNSSNWYLEENPNYVIAGYKAYTVPAEFDIMSGIAIRIIINN